MTFITAFSTNIHDFMLSIINKVNTKYFRKFEYTIRYKTINGYGYVSGDASGMTIDAISNYLQNFIDIKSNNIDISCLTLNERNNLSLYYRNVKIFALLPKRCHIVHNNMVFNFFESSPDDKTRIYHLAYDQ